MAYVLVTNLTDAYIQTLITRNGFTDVTSQHPGLGMYVIQDLDGNLSVYRDMASIRDEMIRQYLIQQNS